MKREYLPRAVAARMAARKSLEAYAAKALDPDTITGAVAKAAADGFYTCRIQFDRPLDLRETEAAKALPDVLTKQEGFELEWVARLVAGRENVTGADVWAFDLLVRW